MTPALAARDRRAIRIGGAAIALLLAWALLLRPGWSGLRADARGLEDQRALLARELGVLRDTVRDAVRARAAGERLALESARLLDRADLLAASAALSGSVRALARTSGVRLQRTEAAIDADSANISIELRADGDYASLIAFLRALERSRRLVRIERLAIDRRVGTDDAGGVLALSATLRARVAPREGSL